jgi:hypothetical protein
LDLVNKLNQPSHKETGAEKRLSYLNFFETAITGGRVTQDEPAHTALPINTCSLLEIQLYQSRQGATARSIINSKDQKLNLHK